MMRRLVCFVLFLSPRPAVGFALLQKRTCRLPYINAKQASSTEDGPRKKKRPRKSRRFAQDAHSVVPKKNRRRRREQGDDKENKQVFSSSTSPPPEEDTDFMWRSGKSIEELESIMTKRWGTEVQRWTADPNEYEFVDQGSSNDNNGMKDAPTKKQTFRGKPVLDPWQKEEQKQNVATQEESGGFFSSQDSAMLNRVRKNQERLQEKPGRASRKEEPDWDDDNDESDVVLEDDIPDDMVMEFYDEDDEGFEPSRYRNDDEDGLYSMDNLINPKPVGGRGSNSITETRMEKSTSPGFFFNDAAAVQSPSEPTEATPEQKTAKSRRNQSRSRAVLDQDGNPMYLTVDQAQRNFEATLEPDQDSNDVVYTPPVTRTWEELGITSTQLLRNLQKIGCGAPLSVQDKACPPVLTGNDVLVGTYTGSGKTLAFLAPLAQRLLFTGAASGNNVQVLIVAPGRELASQIVSVARSLLEGTDLSVMLAIGGTTFGRNLEQIRKRKPSILVGTPGRIAELVVGRPGETSGRLKVGSLQSLVLDEFDALLEYKPHRDPTNAIVQSLKRRHGDALQSILCSATASDMMNSPKLQSFLRQGYAQAMADQDDQLITSGEETAANDSSTVTRVSRTVMHGAIHVPHRRVALETLRRILHTEPLPQQILVFADTSHRVEIVVDKLSDMGIIAAPLHGGRGNEKVDRAEVSKALREGYVGIVVATEMAARGLDAPLLTHVINLDLPTDASHYAHRAGRCGRGGRPGVVINFTTKPKERNVPRRFAEALGITMHDVEARGGKLCVVEPSHTDTINS